MQILNTAMRLLATSIMVLVPRLKKVSATTKTSKPLNQLHSTSHKIIRGKAEAVIHKTKAKSHKMSI